MPDGKGAESRRCEAANRLLAQRLKAAFWLALAGVVLGAVGDWAVDPSAMARLYPLVLIEAGFLLAARGALQLAIRPRHVLCIAVVGVIGIAALTGLSGVFRPHRGETEVFLAVIALAAATLLPWGGRPQVVVAAAIGAIALGTAYAPEEGSRAVASLHTIPVAIALCVSVYLAYDLERRRRGDEERNQVLHWRGAALAAAANGIAITDRAGRILWVNPALERLTGYTPAELVGQTPRLFKSGKQDAAFYRQLWQTILAGTPWRGEVVNRRKDDSLYAEEMTITPVRGDDGAVAYFVAVKQDVTARKQAEERIARLNRLYAALSKINEALLRIRDPQRLYEEACRIAVEEGRLRMASVGVPDWAAGIVRLAARAGAADDYLDTFTVRLADVPEGWGPAAVALREERPAIWNDCSADPRPAPWRDNAVRYGYRSAAAFPIVAGGRPVAALALYAGEVGFLAEDNCINQRLIVRLLEKNGHRVVIAADGEEAVAAAAREPFDVVLMDVQMPRLDGFEAAAAIRRRERDAGGHLPIVALTAHAMKGDETRCLEAGMDAYVSKPVDARILFEALARLVAPAATPTSADGYALQSGSVTDADGATEFRVFSQVCGRGSGSSRAPAR